MTPLVNFNQASIKALRLPPYHSAIPQSKEHYFNPTSIIITINMTHIFLFEIFIVKVKQMKFELNLLRFLCPLSKLLIIVVKLV